MSRPGGAGSGEEPSLIYLVGRVNQGIHREMRARLQSWDLSVAEYTTLSIMKARPLLSNAQLARRALVAPPSMIEIMVRLERRGLVHREPDSRHARILRSRLSEEGERLLAEATPRILSIQEQILCEVPERQRSVLLAGMRSAMDQLSQGLPDPT